MHRTWERGALKDPPQTRALGGPTAAFAPGKRPKFCPRPKPHGKAARIRRALHNLLAADGEPRQPCTANRSATRRPERAPSSLSLPPWGLCATRIALPASEPLQAPLRRKKAGRPGACGIDALLSTTWRVLKPTTPPRPKRVDIAECQGDKLRIRRVPHRKRDAVRSHGLSQQRAGRVVWRTASSHRKHVCTVPQRRPTTKEARACSAKALPPCQRALPVRCVASQMASST